MTTTDKLKAIIKRCKASFSITVNQHKDYYQTSTEYIENLKSTDNIEIESEEDQMIIDEIIKLDNIIEIHAYADTPVGSYYVIHYDLTLAIDEMYNILNL